MQAGVVARSVGLEGCPSLGFRILRVLMSRVQGLDFRFRAKVFLRKGVAFLSCGFAAIRFLQQEDSPFKALNPCQPAPLNRPTQ